MEQTLKGDISKVGSDCCVDVDRAFTCTESDVPNSIDLRILEKEEEFNMNTLTDTDTHTQSSVCAMLTSAPSSPPHSQPAPATSPPVPVHYEVIERHEAELNNRGSPRILCVTFFISETSLQNRGSKCVNIVASVTRTHAVSDGYYLKREKGNARECRSVFTLVP